MRPRWSRMKKQIQRWIDEIETPWATRRSFEAETRDVLIPGYAI